MADPGGLTELWSQLEQRGLLVDPRVSSVLRSVSPAAFVTPPLAAATFLDAPIATAMTAPRAILPPPRILVMLLQMLEIEKGVRILLLGSSGGYVEALLARLASPAPVTVWEEDTSLAASAQSALSTIGLTDRVSFVSAPPEGTRFDRVVTTDQIVRIDSHATALIADLGFAAYRAHRETLRFVKLLRSGEEFLELTASDVAIPRPSGTEDRIEAGTRIDVARELALGRLLENAWVRRPESEHDTRSAQVVDETFAPTESLPPMSVEERNAYDAAKVLFHLGYIYQSAGDFDASVDAYRASLAVRPTAEAHTFLGWVHSFEDRYLEAIGECEKAIAVDPSFGNPYNDIGAYLIELDRPDESIPWFEKAKASERYCCYFYPYSNLGRVYLMKGMREKARREFEQALRINPEYRYAQEMLRRVGRAGDYFA